jgi:hypothetical protein
MTTDTDIRAALAEATDGVTAAPDLLDRVRTGGHRRIVRRRTFLAAGAATAVAGSAASVLLTGGRRLPTPDVASPFLDAPTRGDLRGDAGFLTGVRAAWGRHVAGVPGLLGEPHVIWAGTVPFDGRAAAVAQRVRQREVSSLGQIAYGVMGFVAPTGRGLEGISLEEMTTLADCAPAVLLGSQRTVLLVLDDGRGIEYSADRGYDAQGRVRRTFEPLTFDADGAETRLLEPQTGWIQFGLRAGRPGADRGRFVKLANFSQVVEARRNRRSWRSLRIDRLLPGGSLDWPDAWHIATHEGYGDPYGYDYPVGDISCRIRGVAGGDRFAVETVTLDDMRIRLFLMVGRPEPHFVGYVDLAAVLPVQVRLPDGRGVVVAAQGAALRYRAGGGTWLPVRGDAALLPDAATEVEVTPPGGRPGTVVLPR